MLLSETVLLRWNGSFASHYMSKGYQRIKNGSFFTVSVNDLQNSSMAKVDVICDYCSKEFEKPYRDYLKQRKIISKDCCKKCKLIKQREMMMLTHGVDNAVHLQDKELLRKKYKKPFNEVLMIFSEKVQLY